MTDKCCSKNCKCTVKDDVAKVYIVVTSFRTSFGNSDDIKGVFSSWGKMVDWIHHNCTWNKEFKEWVFDEDELVFCELQNLDNPGHYLFPTLTQDLMEPECSANNDLAHN